MTSFEVVDPTTTAAWAALEAQASRIRASSLTELFARDPGRVEALSVEAAGIYLDLSKNLLDQAILRDLIELARQTGVEERRDEMFAGARVNVSEDRRVLHVALRIPADDELVIDDHDVARDVHAVLDQMGRFADAVRSGAWRGATGERISHIINVGIGGSSLGPAMAARALRRFSDAGIEARFVSNVDAANLEAAISGLEPATTLVIVSSKTFTTLETMTNARLLRDWVTHSLGEASVERHFVAVSTNLEAVASFGIDPANSFAFWDFIGGRYSMDSAIGLSTMLLIGPERFGQLLAGFHEVDEHFLSAPIEANLPILLGLLRIWYSVFLGAETLGVMPYAEDLERLPAYLQQLQMESNGKRVDQRGRPVSYPTGPIVWGEPGTNGQHSFFQLLHQGTHLIPIDLIGVLMPLSDEQASHDLLIANLLAQAEALAFGRSAEAVAASGVPADQVPFRSFPGNRPSTLILLDELNPRGLGALVALYEHDVFTQGAVLGIDSFDQWGVELGKSLATALAADITAPELSAGHDESTTRALERYRALRRQWA